jgi:hypothetical protein
MTKDAVNLLQPLDRIDRGFQLAQPWPLPTEIRVEDDLLCYRPWDPAHVKKWITAPGIILLTEFLKLADAPAVQIERFARRWGVLGLCDRHLLPLRHPQFGDQWEQCLLATAEPLETWRHYSKFLRSALDEAEQLKQGGRLKVRNAQARKALDHVIGAADTVVWNFGCVRPVLVEEHGRFDIKFGGAGGYTTALATALTTQFLFSISGAAGRLATCGGCGRLFPPRRRPRAGEASFCASCGIHAAWRAAQARRRKKSRGRIYAPRKDGYTNPGEVN